MLGLIKKNSVGISSTGLVFQATLGVDSHLVLFFLFSFSFSFLNSKIFLRILCCITCVHV